MEDLQSCSRNDSADSLLISTGSRPTSRIFSVSVILMPGQYSIHSTLSVVYSGYVKGALMLANLGLSKFVLLIGGWRK